MSFNDPYFDPYAVPPETPPTAFDAPPVYSPPDPLYNDPFMPPFPKRKPLLPKKTLYIIVGCVAGAVVVGVAILVVVLLLRRPASCPDKKPVYAFWVEWGNFPVMANTPTFYGEQEVTPINDGQPVFHLCPAPADNLVPIHVYGHSEDPSNGFEQVYRPHAEGATLNGIELTMQNLGQPLGYAYKDANSLGRRGNLRPIYVVKFTFSSNQYVEFLSTVPSVTFEGTFTYTEDRIIGYYAP